MTPRLAAPAGTFLRVARTPSRPRGRPAARATPPDADADADAEPPALPGDWRAFRAAMVAKTALEAGETAGPGGDVWSSRWTPENLHLLQTQDRDLAREPLWAHSTETVEAGGIVVATPGAAAALADDRAWQLVAYVTSHSPAAGTTALILNRPATPSLSDLLGWGISFAGGGGEGGDAAAAAVEAAFGAEPVYLGGYFAPNRIAAQRVTLLHGVSGLPGAAEVAPGARVYTGGALAAAAAVASGDLAPSRVRLFAGELTWPPGALQAEVDGGAWHAACASRSLVLKHCLRLPVPLWREALTLMGGEFAREAGRREP